MALVAEKGGLASRRKCVRFPQLFPHNVLCAAALLFILSVSCGCSYLTYRRRDAVDILTASVVTGAGVTVQAGPLVNGAGYNQTVMGIEDGDVFKGKGALEWAFVLASAKGNWDHKNIERRHKFYQALLLLGIMGVSPHGEPVQSGHYCTKAEIAASLGYGVKLGLNPGEVLDFLLGFAGLDIYGDDVWIPTEDIVVKGELVYPDGRPVPDADLRFAEDLGSGRRKTGIVVESKTEADGRFQAELKQYTKYGIELHEWYKQNCVELRSDFLSGCLLNPYPKEGWTVKDLYQVDTGTATKPVLDLGTVHLRPSPQFVINIKDEEGQPIPGLVIDLGDGTIGILSSEGRISGAVQNFEQIETRHCQIPFPLSVGVGSGGNGLIKISEPIAVELSRPHANWPTEHEGFVVTPGSSDFVMDGIWRRSEGERSLEGKVLCSSTGQPIQKFRIHIQSTVVGQASPIPTKMPDPSVLTLYYYEQSSQNGSFKLGRFQEGHEIQVCIESLEIENPGFCAIRLTLDEKSTEHTFVLK